MVPFVHIDDVGGKLGANGLQAVVFEIPDIAAESLGPGFLAPPGGPLGPQAHLVAAEAHFRRGDEDVGLGAAEAAERLMDVEKF